MTTKKAVKALKVLVKDLGYDFVRTVKHGDLYRHPTHVSATTGTLAVVSFGGSPSDCNFHRQVVRELRRNGHNVDYLNG